MKILITGAGGFLGSYLARQLQYNVTALTRQELDLSDLSAVKDHFNNNRYDVVLHCGAAGRNTPATEDSIILATNLASIINLMTYRDKFDQLINIGTGAEFDISQPIECAKESEVFARVPSHSYGKSKNLISRYLQAQPGCFNLRLFGCFDNSEDDRRLFKKLHSSVAAGNAFNIEDKPFDIISAADFAVIVSAVIDKKIVHRDINCVYAEKHSLSEILKMYCETHQLDSSLVNVTGQGKSYTGSGDILEQYKLPLLGLRESLSRY